MDFLRYDSLRDHIKATFQEGSSPGPEGMRLAWSWTALGDPQDELTFRVLIERRPVKTCVEIGTYQGVSTALLAEYADVVHTIDIFRQPLCKPLWRSLGFERKIIHEIVSGNDDKRRYIESLPAFDLAFIDGNHAREEALLDFELVRRCGRVIFHDSGFIGVSSALHKLFMDGEIIELHEPFAYWEKS